MPHHFHIQTKHHIVSYYDYITFHHALVNVTHVHTAFCNKLKMHNQLKPKLASPSNMMQHKHDEK